MATDPVGNGLTEEQFQIAMEGVSIQVPHLWEARISRNAQTILTDGVYPVLHVATIPLPAERGDYGSNVVEALSSEDIFVGLIEFGPEAVDSALFPRADEMPRSINPDEFHPRQLQRVLPGQAGKQVFFTVRGRAFCLYVVLGSYARRFGMMPRLTDLLGQITITSRESLSS